MTVGTQQPMGDLLIAALLTALLLFWLMLAYQVLLDILRSDDLNGTRKALWVASLLCLPLVGALGYIVRRGASTSLRHSRSVQSQQETFEDYIRSVAHSKE